VFIQFMANAQDNMSKERNSGSGKP